MSEIVWGVTIFSAVGLVVWGVRSLFAHHLEWRTAVPVGLVFVAGLLATMILLKSPIEVRGDSDLSIVIVCYVAMLLGIVAQFLFYSDSKATGWSGFWKPLLVSPMVFMPLLLIIGSGHSTGETFGVPRLMLYAVAFENGFFWKVFFESRKKAVGDLAA